MQQHSNNPTLLIAPPERSHPTQVGEEAAYHAVFGRVSGFVFAYEQCMRTNERTNVVPCNITICEEYEYLLFFSICSLIQITVTVSIADQDSHPVLLQVTASRAEHAMSCLRDQPPCGHPRDYTIHTASSLKRKTGRPPAFCLFGRG